MKAGYIGRMGSSSGVAFRPVASGLTLWLDASDTSTITSSGGAVSQWNDKSGNGNNATQGTGSAQPGTGAVTKNGKNVLTFDGGDFLSLPSGLYSIPNGDNTIFYVSTCTDESADRFILTMIGAANAERLLCYSTSIAGVQGYRNVSTNNPVTRTGITKANYNIFTQFLSGTTQSISVNNGTAGTNTSGVNAVATIATIGAYKNSGFTGNYQLGNIAEIIIYNRALTAAEIIQVNRYLSNKWNISITVPLSLAPTLWLDASDSSTITSVAGAVSQWNDKSGNGYNVTQAVSAAQPTTGVATQNSLNVLTFDGSDTLALPAALYSIPNGSYTIFAVAKSSVDNALERIICMTDGINQVASLAYTGTSGQIAYLNNSSFNAVNVNGTKANFNIFYGRRSGTTQAISINNAAEVSNTNAVNLSGITVANIGSFANFDTFLTGSIAEILIFNKSLSATDIISINQYLSAKWGVAIS